MKLLNKLRKIRHLRVQAEINKARTNDIEDEASNAFDKYYQTQTNQLHSSTGLVAGWYQFIGDKNEM